MNKANLATLTLGIALSSVAIGAGDPVAGEAKAAVCTACHGADGKAVIPGYPNLAGQNELYLINSIKAYRSGDRKPVGNGAVMAGQAAALSDADIENLAAYYAAMAN
ncbi:cytochrome c [uncultured Umboniibacter sp.]|uniref:c-type cytochrome n=1 Tax=uncultured Umboniibacter sp. TaxID=1798917 RepID=UPI0026082569|nr:cytochrome c [uncultured Umboniibacter sp.]